MRCPPSPPVPPPTAAVRRRSASTAGWTLVESPRSPARWPRRGRAEPVGVNILDVLRRSPVAVCQCELVPLFEIPQSTLSHHLKKLVEAGLVEVERRHRWAYYSLPPNPLQELTAWLS